MTQNEILVGIVGANAEKSWAKVSHVPAIKGLPGLRLAAVATREIAPELSLAYIRTASSTAQRDELEHRSRRFRLGDKKEAAGVCRGRGDQPGMYGY
jgi:hypothetical protein